MIQMKQTLMLQMKILANLVMFQLIQIRNALRQMSHNFHLDLNLNPGRNLVLDLDHLQPPQNLHHVLYHNNQIKIQKNWIESQDQDPNLNLFQDPVQSLNQDLDLDPNQAENQNHLLKILII